MSGCSIKAFHSLVMLLAIGILGSLPLPGSVARQEDRSSGPSNSLHWQSPARLHHGFRTAKGTLIFNNSGIEFHSDNQRFSHRWSFVEVKTFDITSHRLVITDYENRGHHMPGDRRYRFDLTRPAPPAVAEQLADLVEKPVINRDPNAHGEAFTMIPARHRTLMGGTNGTLRFSEEGIDYVTSSKRGSRNWRWQDIQTIALPDSYHFRVGGYREIFDFELKQPMSRYLFDRLWDAVYGRGLQLSVKGRHSENSVGVAQSGMEQER